MDEAEKKARADGISPRPELYESQDELANNEAYWTYHEADWDAREEKTAQRMMATFREFWRRGWYKQQSDAESKDDQ